MQGVKGKNFQSNLISYILGMVILFFSTIISSTQSFAADFEPAFKNYIVGADDRVTIDMDEYPWTAIGRVIAETKVDGGNCTGALVGPRIVLTAAHCLYSDTGFQARSVKFFPYSKKKQLSARAIALYIPENFDIKKSEISKRQSKYDWALLALDTPLGRDIGFFSVREINKVSGKWPNNNFFQAGFSADSREKLTAHMQCTVLRTGFRDSVVYHECDGMPGDSGAPIWANFEGKPNIIAVFGSIQFNNQRDSKAMRGVAASSTFVTKVMEWRDKYK